MILQIFGQRLARIEKFLELGVGDVAADNDRSVQRQLRGDRMFAQFRQDLLHRLIEVDFDDAMRVLAAVLVGNQAARIRVHLFEPDAVFVDLGFDVAVGRAGDAHADRTGGAVPRQTNDAHVVRKVFAAELCADAALLGRLEQLGFHLQVAEGLAAFVAFGRQVIQIAGGSEFDGFERALGAGAADDKRQVIGRTGGGAEGFHLGHQEFFQTLRIEQGLGFLEQIGLVGAAAAFGNEQEFVFVAFGGIEIDLGGQIAAGVDLLVHVQREWSGNSAGFLRCRF